MAVDLSGSSVAQRTGLAKPILADSGNGYHLLYRIDLPCDDGGLVKDLLNSLAKRFDNDRVKIHTNVFNPGRITKLYGTIARKGDSIRERPHRRTGILNVPTELAVVAREQLVAVRGEIAPPAVPTAQPVIGAPTSMYAQVRANLVQRARNYLAKVPGAISGDGGSNQTFKAACILVRFGLTDEEAMTLLTMEPEVRTAVERERPEKEAPRRPCQGKLEPANAAT